MSKITLLANQELTTVRSASRLALSLRQRYGKERVEIVMSRYDKNAEIRREDVERVTGGTVQRLIPSDYRLALEASNKGRPVVVDNHNRLAASLVSLARGLAGLDAETSGPQSDRPACSAGSACRGPEPAIDEVRC